MFYHIFRYVQEENILLFSNHDNFYLSKTLTPFSVGNAVQRQFITLSHSYFPLEPKVIIKKGWRVSDSAVASDFNQPLIEKL